LTPHGSLFLFDEPTTGLHFDDIAKLLKSLRQLVAAGHSLIIIEHNLDVIRAADWVIDLGPEGGDAGGEIVSTGTPREVMACAASHTGKALREYEAALHEPPKAAEHGSLLYSPASRRSTSICVHNAREHNLKSLHVE